MSVTSDGNYSMSDWLHEIEIELQRGEQSSHPGRIRTVARRIAGIAIRRYQNFDMESSNVGDYPALLRTMMNSKLVPHDVRDAAARLEARLSPDFTSPSVNPIADAMLIVGFVKAALEKRNDGINSAHEGQ